MREDKINGRVITIGPWKIEAQVFTCQAPANLIEKEAADGSIIPAIGYAISISISAFDDNGIPMGVHGILSTPYQESIYDALTDASMLQKIGFLYPHLNRELEAFDNVEGETNLIYKIAQNAVNEYLEMADHRPRASAD